LYLSTNSNKVKNSGIPRITNRYSFGSYRQLNECVYYFALVRHVAWYSLCSMHNVICMYHWLYFDVCIYVSYKFVLLCQLCCVYSFRGSDRLSATVGASRRADVIVAICQRPHWRRRHGEPDARAPSLTQLIRLFPSSSSPRLLITPCTAAFKSL